MCCSGQNNTSLVYLFTALAGINTLEPVMSRLKKATGFHSFTVFTWWDSEDRNVLIQSEKEAQPVGKTDKMLNTVQDVLLLSHKTKYQSANTAAMECVHFILQYCAHALKIKICHIAPIEIRVAQYWENKKITVWQSHGEIIQNNWISPIGY